MSDNSVKIGIYICSGCEIGQCLDVDSMVKVAEKECKAAVVKTSEHLCDPEGVKMINDDIASEALNRVVICGCSAREKTAEFYFSPPVMVERVNLREYVAWSQEPNEEETQELAEDYIIMGAARAGRCELPEVLEQEIDKTIMVVGGGVSGMTAALSAAGAGYKVVLVEKEAELGGWSRRFSKVFPKSPPYKELEQPLHIELIKKIEANDNITVHKSTVIKKMSGAPGLFDVTLRNGGEPVQIRIGSVVQATGWKPYDPEKLGHLGYGASPNVITNVQLEEMVKDGEVKRPSDGKKVESVAFIQCAGSRDQDHLPYCSAVCCRASMKQAKYIREMYPDCKVYILYKDVRSPGQFELFYQSVQDDEGVFFIKGEVAGVGQDSEGGVVVELTDTLMGEDMRVQADMLVLASGMVPTTKVEEIVEEPAEDKPAEEKGDDKKKVGASAEAGAKILNLDYRLGTDLPTLKYGFPDSHFICFPYETRRTGIYAAGAVRAPMDFAGAVNDAYGAALKAIQAVECIDRGEAVHPRTGDVALPEFYLERCTQCKRCTEECPFGSLDEDEKGTPLPNPNRCRRCGICMGACPERIVSFKDYSIPIIGSMIKALDIPEEFDEKPRVLAFMCENDAVPALDIAAAHRMKWSPYIRIIPLRCLGSMNVVWIADALSAGYDGIILIGCKYGDDYQCHYVHGSELANTRMENVQDKLKQLVLETERVVITSVSLNEWAKIPEIFAEFMEGIDAVGPNPYK
ncbi:MAG: FAD-dependent oxidoreductase [candidate division Zixibacteria bacterium]|nr:FAD-dependent oxidoreductase [Candidatus Tariuqbacter arcticus]